MKMLQLAQKIRQKELKVISDSAALEAKKVAARIAKRQNTGSRVLYDSGYLSEMKNEDMTNKSQKAEAELTEYINKLASTKNDLERPQQPRDIIAGGRCVRSIFIPGV